MSDREALLRAILLDPSDDVARLAYADDIEGDDPQRAEFIRVQCELVDSTCARERARTLLLANWSHWEVPMVGPRESFQVILSERWRYNGVPGCEFRRGFVDRLEMPTDAFLTHAAALFSQHPITEVRLTDKTPHKLMRATFNERDMLLSSNPKMLSSRQTFGWGEEWGRLSRPHSLPYMIYARLSPKRMGLQHGEYDEEEEAHADLSRALVEHGREAAGLFATR